MYRVCVNPLKRSFGGKNPLRSVRKNKTRKQLQRILLPRLKALEKQVSGYMRINSDLIAENEALRAYITRDSRLIAEYIEKIFVLQAVLRAEGFRVSLRSFRGADAQ